MGRGFPVASHFTVSLLPSSTIIGFLIGFNFGAAAGGEKKKREREENDWVLLTVTDINLSLQCWFYDCVLFSFGFFFVLGRTARQKRSQSSSPRTQPTALSCDHQMLSLEILSTLSKTNKQAEFHSAAAAAAMKTPEAIFIRAQSDKQNTFN